MGLLDRLRDSQYAVVTVRGASYNIRHLSVGEQEEAKQFGDDAYLFTVARSLVDDDRAEAFPRLVGETAESYLQRIRPQLETLPYALLLELYVAICEETMLKLTQRTEAVQKKYGIAGSQSKPSS